MLVLYIKRKYRTQVMYRTSNIEFDIEALSVVARVLGIPNTQVVLHAEDLESQ